MKKRLMIVAVFVMILTVVVAGFYYQMIRTPLTNEEQEAVAIALAETELEQVEAVEFYHGTDSYQVIRGTDHDGEQLIVWVSTDENEIVMRRAKDGLSHEQVEQFASQQLAPRELISIRLGIEQDLPVYEITYLDNERRYAYYYMTFKDGTFVKRYSLRHEQ